MIGLIIICWAILAVYWITSSFFVKRSIIKRNWWGGVIPLAIIIIVVIFIRIRGTQHNVVSFLTLQFFNVSLASEIIGAAITLMGLVVAVWARTIIGRNWSGYVSLKENHELVTSGPYSVIRHPIYTGFLLMIIGTAIYYASVLALIYFVIDASIFLWRAKREEALMIKTFGKKYQDYMKRTKALIPFVV